MPCIGIPRWNCQLSAGAAGFEPTNGGSKVRCLATWRRPNQTWIPIIRVANIRHFEGTDCRRCIDYATATTGQSDDRVGSTAEEGIELPASNTSVR